MVQLVMGGAIDSVSMRAQSHSRRILNFEAIVSVWGLFFKVVWLLDSSVTATVFWKGENAMDSSGQELFDVLLHVRRVLDRSCGTAVITY